MLKFRMLKLCVEFSNVNIYLCYLDVLPFFQRYQIFKVWGMHKASFARKRKWGSNLLLQRENFVKPVRQQYGNPDLHAFSSSSRWWDKIWRMIPHSWSCAINFWFISLVKNLNLDSESRLKLICIPISIFNFSRSLPLGKSRLDFFKCYTPCWQCQWLIGIWSCD